MLYQGSKSRLAKHILPIILERRNDRIFVDAFCGGCNLIDKVKGGVRIANDINPYLIALLIKLQSGWEPPFVTEKKYLAIRDNKEEYPRHMVGLAGVVTFGGGWYSGYAQPSTKRNYVLERINNMVCQSPNLKGIRFRCKSYTDLRFAGRVLIYCDPPYKNTRQYANRFNHKQFWEWCRFMKSRGHLVYVSEYSAPKDIKCVWEKAHRSCMNSSNGSSKKTVERLYKV